MTLTGTLTQRISRSRAHWLSPSTADATTASGTSLRIRTLEATAELACGVLDRCGITRVADVTDLDVLGIPVFNSCRPDAAPGLNTVTSGKGTTMPAARVSAMMEAIERTWCEPRAAEPPLRASYADLVAAGLPTLDPRRLILRRGHRWTEQQPLSWWPARELRSGTEVLIPALAVFTPFPDEYGMFSSNTIGLASGNSPREALLHGLLELVEHDCTAFGETLRGGHRIRSATLPAEAQTLVTRFEQAGIRVQVFGYANEIGMPTIFVTTDDTHAEDGLLINGGAGCHPDPTVALSRALTEAAQSRLNVISGAREDLNGQVHRRHASYEEMQKMLHTWSAGRPELDFGELPHRTTGTVEADLDLVLDGLDLAGLELVFATELAPPDLPFSVTQVIVPGIENYHNDPARLGTRLHAAMARAELARSPR
ncbi:YcaO-like family protein [Streptomyces sp. H27-D2]|uniref:YcaO-like family protein n=1 Tax=Streptomyces sp. H27-D2 TaxID=3046304 RepID=UPI002DBE4049|nr:YcaO-like family protein [Streptomyces sp. H27-D2]MEC4019764.1 YcaO-like family protein [Streptomyces sp. H27-D2]